jgi:hypothetical protein
MRRTVMMAALAGALMLGVPAMAADKAAPMPAYPGVPADLAAAAAAFDRAQVTSDGAALARLLADDYLLINSQDQREDKAQFIADYTAKGFSMEPFAIDDQVIKVWSDGAVLGGAVTMKGLSEGKPYSVRIRFSDIWAKRGGKWQVIYTHANRVAAN